MERYGFLKSMENTSFSKKLGNYDAKNYGDYIYTDVFRFIKGKRKNGHNKMY